MLMYLCPRLCLVDIWFSTQLVWILSAHFADLLISSSIQTHLNTCKIENGNREYAKETTARPESR